MNAILKIRSILGSLKFYLIPRVVDFIVYMSTWFARGDIKNNGVLNILVDGTVLYHSVLFETKWISTGAQSWGGHLPLDSGYMARVPVHGKDSDREIIDNIRYLPGLRELHRTGFVKLWTSEELIYEQFCQPSGRYFGYGLYDYALFKEIRLDSVDGFGGDAICEAVNSREDPVRMQRERMQKHLQDQKFRNLVRALGEKNSQDAWHLYTAEMHGMFCFLTMDFKFIRNVERQKDSSGLKGVNARAISPADLGKYLKLVPISPRLYAFHGVSFPVDMDTEMGGGKRRPLRDYKKQ